jgi:tetratricopeptide (TPR) repeat protein
MTRKRLKLEHALDVLPEVDELVPLRAALADSSRPDEEKFWAESQEYLTLQQRVALPERLQERVPELVEQVRRHTEGLFRHATLALEAVQNGDLPGAAGELVAAGEMEEAARRFDRAERYYRKALELGRRPRNRAAEGLALRRLGRVARARGDLDAALRLYRKGYEVADAQRDVQGAVVACQGLGNVWGDQGRWDEARRWYQRGLELLGASAASAQLWEICVNLATVERHAGDLAGARGWLERAEKAIRETGDPRGAFFLENNRGQLHVAAGNPVRAEEACRRAVEHASDPYLRTVALVNLAESLLLQRRVREAATVAREAERLAIGAGITVKLPAVYRLLGAVARAAGEPDSFVFFEQALSVGREFGAPPVEYALTQRDYGIADAEDGNREAARARLGEAERVFEELGSRVELDTVRERLKQLS